MSLPSAGPAPAAEGAASSRPRAARGPRGIRPRDSIGVRAGCRRGIRDGVRAPSGGGRVRTGRDVASAGRTGRGHGSRGTSGGCPDLLGRLCSRCRGSGAFCDSVDDGDGARPEGGFCQTFDVIPFPAKTPRNPLTLAPFPTGVPLATGPDEEGMKPWRDSAAGAVGLVPGSRKRRRGGSGRLPVRAVARALGGEGRAGRERRCVPRDGCGKARSRGGGRERQERSRPAHPRDRVACARAGTTGMRRTGPGTARAVERVSNGGAGIVGGPAQSAGGSRQRGARSLARPNRSSTRPTVWSTISSSVRGRA